MELSLTKLPLMAFIYSLLALSSNVAEAIELLVPAYANPCCNGGPNMWSNLTSTAAASGVNKVNIILNPGSGPAPHPDDGGIDPNYINPNSVIDPLLEFTAAGGIAYGYVSTVFATRNITLIKADVDTYYDSTYWRGAPVQVSGIFFDEMSNNLDDVDYFQELRDYVKAINASAKVIMNPGTSFLNNGTKGFTASDFAETADTIVTFEQTGDNYRNPTFYMDPSWLNDYSEDHFAHLIHTESTIADMQTDVALACTRKAGMLYVTDDALPNPWDYLATYWDDLVTEIQSTSCLSQDNDGDGVPDADDLCPDTVIPESIPTVELKANRWALTDDDTIFDTVHNPDDLSFTISDTGGCSGEQIIEALGLGKGHEKFGVSTGAMMEWINITTP